jgi:nitrite reductase/ring-hydroxylating ferredoxin subunit
VLKLCVVQSVQACNIGVPILQEELPRADKQIAILNVDGVVYAMDDFCLHKGSSLGSGQLDGTA